MGKILIAHAATADVSKYMRLETSYTTGATCQARKERKAKSIPPQGMIPNTDEQGETSSVGHNGRAAAL